MADLIRLYDQLDREVRRLEADGQDRRLLWSFAEDVAQILDRCGIEIFSAEPGDPFERDRHRPLAVVTCDDESRHNTVAEVVAVGLLRARDRPGAAPGPGAFLPVRVRRRPGRAGPDAAQSQ